VDGVGTDVEYEELAAEAAAVVKRDGGS